MVGQDFVVATLQKSIAAGKIAHAYLFSGPRGCGKTSSARILARALNCQEGPSATPCGTCPACTEIARGSSLDVIEIDGASNTSVNDVRQIKDEVQFPPNSSRYKVYIIDEVHMLSTSAFNALLKTIEEPPPYVIFIFATTELHKVPATIKSRCQQFNFRLVPVELLKAVLSEAATETGTRADDEALFWIAREATGSVRDAYTLFDQVAAFSDGHITYEKIRDKLGLVGVDRINPVIDACVDRDAGTALTALEDILQNGVSVEQFTVDLADYFRSLLLLKSGISRESLLGQAPDRFSAKVLASWSPVQIERALGIMLQLYRDIRYSLDPRYELDLAVSRLSWISDYVSSAELKTAIGKARHLLEGGAVARAGSGPFSGADLSAGDPRPETVRPAEPPAPVAPTVGAAGEEDTDVRIENPFAAFKEKLSGRLPGTLPVQAVPAAKPDRADDLPDASPAETHEESAQPHGEKAETVPFELLQDSLVAFFRDTKSMVATSLAQASGWKEENGMVRFTVDKPFVHNFLEQEHKTIAVTASQLLGRQVGIEIALESSRSSGSAGGDRKPPVRVEMVRQMFRGTIVEEG